MTDTRSAWTDVADHLSALCLKLKLHAEEELSDADIREKVGLERLRAVVDETVDAIEDAYEDQAVRDDARQMARSFVHAIDVTVRDLGDRVRSASTSSDEDG